MNFSPLPPCSPAPLHDKNTCHQINGRHGNDPRQGGHKAQGEGGVAEEPDGGGHEVAVEGFTAVVALEEEGEAGGGGRPFGVCLGRVKLPPLVENGEQRPFGHGQRIEAVVRLIVVQPQRQGGQVVYPQPEGEEEDGEEGGRRWS